jgi:hypothetical protein
MRATDRRIVQSPLYQGVDEEIVYTLTTTPWGSDPSSPSVVLKDADGDDVSDTYLDGLPSVAGDVISTPAVVDLVAGVQYRLEIKFTIDGNVVETWADLIGQT